MRSQRCKISPSALLHPVLTGCYVCMAEHMLRKCFNISWGNMKNASLWTVSARLEQEDEGKLVGSRGERRKIQRRSWNKWVASRRWWQSYNLPIQVSSALILRGCGGSNDLDLWANSLEEFTLEKAEAAFHKQPKIKNNTLKINSGAGVPCHNLSNVVHKEKDWQANAVRSCRGCPHRSELKHLRIERVREVLQPRHTSAVKPLDLYWACMPWSEDKYKQSDTKNSLHLD